MSVASISSTSSSSSTDSTTSDSSRTTLSQEDFLQLLCTQMSSQDPLNPQSDTEFAAQLAQFTALSTAQTTEKDVSNLYNCSQIQEANDMIGRKVTLTDSDGTSVSGTVSGVTISSGVPQILINGTGYDLGDVVSVSSSSGS